MAISATPVEIAQFGDFEVDLRSRELRSRKNRASVRLPDQSFEVLAMLLQHPGELVTREDIRKRLWPADTFVDFDHGLNNAVKRLRDALGDSAETPQFVETLPRRGYRFIAQVKRLDRRDHTSPATETARGDSLVTKLKTRQARLALAIALVALAILLVAIDKRNRPQPGPTRRVMRPRGQ